MQEILQGREFIITRVRQEVEAFCGALIHLRPDCWC